jgi:hypothetical protein
LNTRTKKTTKRPRSPRRPGVEADRVAPERPRSDRDNGRVGPCDSAAAWPASIRSAGPRWVVAAPLAGYGATVKVRPKALILLGAALVVPLAILWARGSIQGPRPLYIGPDTYWAGWLFIVVPVAALIGLVLIIAGAALAFLRQNNVR